MPGGDGRGPMEYGPRSGRGFGQCNRHRRRFGQNVELSKEEQRKILEAEKKKIEKKLQVLE